MKADSLYITISYLQNKLSPASRSTNWYMLQDTAWYSLPEYELVYAVGIQASQNSDMHDFTIK